MELYVTDTIENSMAVLSKDETKHIRIKRHKKGERILLTDGKGNEYTGVIEELLPSCKVRIVEHRYAPRELDVKIDVAWGIIKRERNELVVEKATEIGVSGFYPVYTQRSMKWHNNQNKVQRFKKIALSAMKQSLRSFLPQINYLRDIKTLFEKSKQYDISLIAVQGSNNRIEDYFSKKYKKILYFVGPEGGFTNEEKGEALKHNFIPVNLGKRRLRTETAVIVGLSLIVNYLTRKLKGGDLLVRN